jgi:hypothetical protein
MNKTWNSLSPATRRIIVIIGLADVALRIAAIADLRRRPAEQVNGPKWLWCGLLAVVNSVGLVPVTYFVRGRRAKPAEIA